jgi:hypothetical protein
MNCWPSKSSCTRRAALGGVAITAASVAGFRWLRGRSSGEDGSVPDPRTPWQLTPTPSAVASPAGPQQARAIEHKIRLRPDMSFGALLHWLRVFGTGPLAAANRVQVADVLEDLTHVEKLERRFGARSALMRTPYGLRYSFTDPRSPTSLQERVRHAYQPLAVFAELGIPTNCPLVTPDRVGTVAELIRDCLQNFQLRDVEDIEPEWACAAIALYLPPVTNWQNRWGDPITFDELTRFLLRRLPQAGAACAGTHALFTAAVLMQMHQRFSLLNSSTVARLDDLFATTTAALARAQRPDGSWGGDWSGRGSLYAESTDLALLVTGHVLEALMYAPPDHRVRDEVVARALKFSLKAIEAASEADVANGYCPYSHVARVLLHWPAS